MTDFHDPCPAPTQSARAERRAIVRWLRSRAAQARELENTHPFMGVVTNTLVDLADQIERAAHSGLCPAPWPIETLPVGTLVAVIRDDGSALVTRTRSIAWVTGGNDHVIAVEGITGYCALERVHRAALSPVLAIPRACAP